MSEDRDFGEFFRDATGHAPYPYQVKLGTESEWPTFLDVPTGLGKTAVILAWLWRRRFAAGDVRRHTPRRLVYCLPMRVLAEQTWQNAVRWLDRLGMLAGRAEWEEEEEEDARPTARAALRGYNPLPNDERLARSARYPSDSTRIAVHLLMGGEARTGWALRPERDAILIGTQDMLLSRALNRGYAASRARWPQEFGLLHQDCLWVFDEVQLMGPGLATTAQVEAFRRLGGTGEDSRNCQTLWMSATLQQDWVATVDFAPFLAAATLCKFDFRAEIGVAIDDEARDNLQHRWTGPKTLGKAAAYSGDSKALATEILLVHKASCCKRGAAARTIAVVNTVRRARDLLTALRKCVVGAGKKSSHESAECPRLVLLHSRYRPADREARMREALAVPGPGGTVVLSTQVVEAGVDVSATTLFTDLAPWASLVQRFGRCNRGGDDRAARVFWIDLPKDAKKAEKVARPYELDELRRARERLVKLQDVGLKSLPAVKLPFASGQVIRAKDFVELFDTTPDLAGNDIDIDRFVRDVDETDVRVFWRDCVVDRGLPPAEEPGPDRDELCPVPVGEFRAFLKKHGGDGWRWNFRDGVWQKAGGRDVFPGQVYLLHARAGGYASDAGWNPKTRGVVDVVAPGEPAGQDSTGGDRPSHLAAWATIAEHTHDVAVTIEDVMRELDLTKREKAALRLAARWHDRGKAHVIFQSALPSRDGAGPPFSQLYAKAAGNWRRYARPKFRHELASAMAVLLENGPEAELRDLAAYLVAAHHGKVRLSIRSLPEETRPTDGRRFARGVWEGDELPETDLGDGTVASRRSLSLEPMEIGLGAAGPFENQPSWVERTLRLRDTIGPCRLAFLEAVLRAADARASRAAERRAACDAAGGSVDA